MHPNSTEGRGSYAQDPFTCTQCATSSGCSFVARKTALISIVLSVTSVGCFSRSLNMSGGFGEHSHL